MINALLQDRDWDWPFFKVLAHNDTGAARGHQGGAAIPKGLRAYFPILAGIASRSRPTMEHRLQADLYAEEKYLATVDTRYQYQTWGGERTPEARLTDNLGPLRDLASAGDILVFQRSLASLDHYRLILIRKSSAEYSALAARIQERRWGELIESREPMTQSDLETAGQSESAHESRTLDLFDLDVAMIESHGRRVARSVVFRETVKRIYGGTCSICETALTTPSGASEFQAAHIVPRSKYGTDDARNGIGLCRRHHWAFDYGLFGVSSERRVHVPQTVQLISANAELVQYSGKRIRESTDTKLAASPDAFAWHFEQMVRRFE